jgi:hypothetical protein
MSRLDRLSVAAMVGLGLLVALAQAAGWTPFAFDAGAYFAATPGDLYRYGWYFAGHEYAAFLYSPAFADALIPLRLLPERGFTALWQLGLVVALGMTLLRWSIPVVAAGALAFLVGVPVIALPLADIAYGNIHVLLGFVAVLGLRYPALWSVAILSKVTPGVGLIWFVARRDWRGLVIALSVTAGLTAWSFAYNAGDWFGWLRFLAGSTAIDYPLWVVPVPLWIRIPMAAALTWWGARTNRPWVVPIAVGWSIPMPYPTMLATMVAALVYLRISIPDGLTNLRRAAKRLGDGSNRVRLTRWA